MKGAKKARWTKNGRFCPPFIKNGLLNKDILGNTFLGCNATPINESPKLWHSILWKPVTFYFISKETQCFKGGAWSGYSPLCKSTWGSLELLLLNLVQNMYYTDMLNTNSVTTGLDNPRIIKIIFAYSLSSVYVFLSMYKCTYIYEGEKVY